MVMAKRDLRLLILCILIVSSHTAVSFFEEALFKSLGFAEPFFMILFMCFQYSVLHVLFAPCLLVEKQPGLANLVREAYKSKVHYSLLWLCIAYAGSNSVSKMALEFVSIPTQIVFKSCKLVAVMLGSSCINHKSYSLFEYGVALGLVFGMMCFAGMLLYFSPSQTSAFAFLTTWHLLRSAYIFHIHSTQNTKTWVTSSDGQKSDVIAKFFISSL